MDEAGKYTAQHTVMESGIEIRELKHLLKVSEDKVEKLQAEIETLRGIVRNIDIEDLSIDEELHSITSEKYNKFDDKSLLDSDDEEPNKESY